MRHDRGVVHLLRRLFLDFYGNWCLMEVQSNLFYVLTFTMQ